MWYEQDFVGSFLISAIDTSAGKTMSTGYIAQQLMGQGQQVITHKMVQTGCTNYAEDILVHRQLMGCQLLPEDLSYHTMPQIFAYPASPHLASKLEQRSLDFEQIASSIAYCQERYRTVLIEGAGGLMVPLTPNKLLIDYAADLNLPIILVTSGKLGSINHTLLSLEAIARRGLRLHAIAYNQYFASQDPLINSDTQAYIKQYVKDNFAGTLWIDIPSM